MQNKIIELFIDILERDIGTVQVEDNFRDYEEWDSLSVLSILAEINDEYDVIIPRRLFEEMEKVDDIVKYLEKQI